MWKDRGLWVLLLSAVLISVVTSVDKSPYGDDYQENFDDQFEYLDNSEAEVESAVRDENTNIFIAADPEVTEMTTTQCSTSDRTRTCDCGFTNQDLTVPIFSGNMLQMVIRNCKRVTIRANTFANIYNIGHLTLENIEDLVLQANALSFPIADWGHVNIRFQNVRTDFIPAYTFSGFIQSISFHNCNIGAFERFALNGIRSVVDEVQISNTMIHNCEPYSIKKFTINTLDINNMTTTGTIASKFFYGIEVRNSFMIRNCDLALVQPSAFDMENVDSFSFVSNRIRRLNGEAFRMSLLNGLIIAGNQIDECHPAAFRALTLNDNFWRVHNIPMRVQITSNNVSTMEIVSPLAISDQLQPRIDNLRYLNALTCEDVPRLMDTPFFSTHKNSILFRMEDKLLDTGYNQEGEFFNLSHIANHDCVSRSFFWYYVLIGGSVLLILLLILLILLCVWYRRRKAQRMNLIMPDGRTYRETTIVMQIENHNLLKTDL